MIEAANGTKVNVVRVSENISLQNSNTTLIVPAILTPKQARQVAITLLEEAAAIDGVGLQATASPADAVEPHVDNEGHEIQ